MTPIELVLSKLPDARPTGKGQWQARCPAHDDRNPSLSIAQGDDGKVLFHCKAGCAPADICKTMGIGLRDLFPSKDNTHSKPKGRIVSAYDYRDASGKLLFQVCRFEPKAFRQRRPDGNRGWIWNLNGVPRVLYRLPELLAADKAGPVFIVEGEKDADALAALGLVATCNPGGAGKWKRVDGSPLHGRRVAILPDADAPGRKHAAQVAAALHGKAAEVKVIKLPGAGKDTVDWLAAIPGTNPEDNKADLLALVYAAPVYQPPAEPETEAETGGAVMVCLADVKPERLRWLWPGRIPIGKVSLIAGDPGLGKSLLTLDVAARLSRGLPWPDCPDSPTEAGAVVLLSAEDDVADTIRPRLDAAGADVKRITALQGVMYTDSNTGTAREEMFSLERDLPALEEAITRTGDARLVVIDPITAYLGRTDSHKNAEIRGLLAPLAQLAAKHKVAIVAITHLNKNASGSAMYRAMGSLAFTAAARAYWAVTKDEGNPDRRLFLPVKCNLAADGTGLAYTVQSFPDSPDTPVIAWESDPVTISADEALNQNDNGYQATGDATAWLQEALSDGQVKTKDLQQMAKDSGHAWRTVQDAKKKMGIISRREGFGPGATWYWALPGHRAQETP